MELGRFLQTTVSLLLMFTAGYARADFCSDHGGVRRVGNRSSICVCDATGMVLRTEADAQNCDQATVERIQASLDRFGESQKVAATCGATLLPSRYNPALSCPKLLKDRLLSDQKSSWFGYIQSPKELCQPIKDKQFGSAQELESFLAATPGLSVDAKPGLISSDQCLPPNADESDKKAFVAEYYSSMNRLKAGELSALESLASIDHLLGTPSGKPLEGISCNDPAITEAQVWCQKLAECSIKKGAKSPAFTSQLAEMKQAILLIRELKAERGKVFQAGHGVGRGGWVNTPEQKTQMEALDQAIQQIEQMHPIFSAKEFKSVYESAVNGPTQGMDLKLADGFEAQLKANREQLTEQLKKFQNATRCLNPGAMLAASCSGFDEAVAESPEFTRVPAGEGESDRTKKSMGNYYLDQSSCRRSIRQARSDANGAMQSFAINAGLTVATLGLESVAAGAQAASAALKAGVQVSELSSAARLSLVARAAVLGLDVGYFVKNGYDTYQLCDSVTHQLPPSASVSSRSRGPSCPGVQEGYNGPEVIADYKSCAISIALTVGTAGLRVLPAGVKAFLNFQAAKNASRVLDGRVLSTAEREAIVSAQALDRLKLGANANKSQGIGNYTEEFLRDKAQLLTKAGFKPAEVERLIASGAAGAKPGSALMVKIKEVLATEIKVPGSSTQAASAERALVAEEAKQIAVGDVALMSDENRVAHALKLMPERESLTEAEKKAILAAHNVGAQSEKSGIGTYTWSEIKEKTRILDEAGFKSDEIRAMMEAGVTGKYQMTFRALGVRPPPKFDPATAPKSQMTAAELVSGHDRNLNGPFAKDESIFLGVKSSRPEFEATGNWVNQPSKKYDVFEFRKMESDIGAIPPSTKRGPSAEVETQAKRLEKMSRNLLEQRDTSQMAAGRIEDLKGSLVASDPRGDYMKKYLSSVAVPQVKLDASKKVSSLVMEEVTASATNGIQVKLIPVAAGSRAKEAYVIRYTVRRSMMEFAVKDPQQVAQIKSAVEKAAKAGAQNPQEARDAIRQAILPMIETRVNGIATTAGKQAQAYEQASALSKALADDLRRASRIAGPGEAVVDPSTIRSRVQEIQRALEAQYR